MITQLNAAVEFQIPTFHSCQLAVKPKVSNKKAKQIKDLCIFCVNFKFYGKFLQETCL